MMSLQEEREIIRENYRAISIVNSVCKIYYIIINNRLKRITDVGEGASWG